MKKFVALTLVITLAPLASVASVPMTAKAGRQVVTADVNADQKSPRAERPTFKDGASFTFKNWTGEWTQTYLREENGLLVFRHANRKKSWEVYFTKDLALVRTKGRGDDIENAPHSGFLDFPLYVEKMWTHSYTHMMVGSNQVYQRELKAKVVAYEEVRVPAGKFWAYRIEAENAWVGRGVADETYWYSPDVGFVIKYYSRGFQWEYELIRFNR